MLTRYKIKQIYSLKEKKFRQKEKLFVLEGIKSVNEYIDANKNGVSELYAEKDIAPQLNSSDINIISRSDMRLISNQSTPPGVLALCKLPEEEVFIQKADKLYLALDDISDPGNLGTIIRLCHWFGINEIIASKNTVDCFNPKVIQASMSSFAHIKVYYTTLTDVIKNSPSKVYGTFLAGENIYKAELSTSGIIVIGNESNGISKAVQELIKHKITIPSFALGASAESLNAALAAAVIVSEFKSRV